MVQSVPISSNTFWTPFLGTPFSKKRAPKIKPCFVSSSPHPCVSFPPPPPSTTPKSIISHTHHSLFQCKHFFHSGLVYLVLLLDLNPFFSKLLPLSSHSCPILLLSCFPFLLSSLSITHVFSLFMEDSFTHIYLWHDYFYLHFPAPTCSSVIFTPLLPMFHLLFLLSSSLTKSPPLFSSPVSTLSSFSQLLNLFYCALVL